MDIEERAGKWAREYKSEYSDVEGFAEADLIAAYLAGSAQTQRDYTVDPGPPPGMPCDRHGNVGCAWCIPGPYEECPRCVCSCGAR